MKVLKFINKHFFGYDTVDIGDVVIYTAFVTVVLSMVFVKINSYF